MLKFKIINLENREVILQNFGAILYRADGKTPSCYNGRPTVIMPGILKLLHGIFFVNCLFFQSKKFFKLLV